MKKEKEISIKELGDFNKLITDNILDVPNIPSKEKQRNFLLIASDGKLYSCVLSSNGIASDLKYLSNIRIPLKSYIFFDAKCITIDSVKVPRFVITKMSFYDILMDLEQTYLENRILICVDKDYKIHYKIDPFANQNDFGYKSSKVIYVDNINKYC